MTVVVVNLGSTSLKLARFFGKSKAPEYRSWNISSIDEARICLEKFIGGRKVVLLHRLVHGGGFYNEPTLIDSPVLDKLEGFAHLAPLHMPKALKLIESCQLLSQVEAQWGAFDTAFHASREADDMVYSLPLDVQQSTGIVRYGFHGFSHKHNAIAGLEKGMRTIISIHLGGGCSVCGCVEGKSRYISMGLTPEEGCMMVSRSGTIPAGVVLHMLKMGQSVENIERIINYKSGILGLSEQSDPVLTLSEANIGTLAVVKFVRSVVREVLDIWACLGNVDGVVLSGGIGENNSFITELIIKKLAILSDVSREKVSFVTNHANEELQMYNDYLNCQDNQKQI